MFCILMLEIYFIDALYPYPDTGKIFLLMLCILILILERYFIDALYPYPDSG